MLLNQHDIYIKKSGTVRLERTPLGHEPSALPIGQSTSFNFVLVYFHSKTRTPIIQEVRSINQNL